MSERADRQRWPVIVSALLLTVATAVSLIWTVHPLYDMTGDSSIYIRTAEAMLDGEGYSYCGVPFVVRPPGFSVLLMPVLDAYGTDFQVLNLYVSAFGVLAMVLLFLWIQGRLGVLVGLAMVASVWLNPGLQEFCNSVMSDLPGIVLLLLCLLVERRFRDRPTVRSDLCLGVLIAVATYVRMIHIFLVPAILLARILVRMRSRDRAQPWSSFTLRRLVLPAAVPVLLVLPWLVRNAACTPEGAVEEVRIHSYSVGMWHEDYGDPESRKLTLDELAGRVPVRAQEIASVLGHRMVNADPTTSSRVFAGLLTVAWLVMLVWRREPAELFTGLVLVVLVTYFGFGERLVFPLYLLTLAWLLELLLLALRRPLGRKVSPVLVATAVVALTVVDFDSTYHRSRIQRRYDDLVAVSTFLEEHVPRDAPLVAYNGRHYAVMLDRRIHSMQFGYRRHGVDRALEIVAEKRPAAIVMTEENDLSEALEARYPVVFETRRTTVLWSDPDRPRPGSAEDSP